MELLKRLLCKIGIHMDITYCYETRARYIRIYGSMNHRCWSGSHHRHCNICGEEGAVFDNGA